MDDNQITHKGVTYTLSTNLPPMKTHVMTCPYCSGDGQMYGKNCTECKGRGLLFPPFPGDPALGEK